MTLKSDEKFEDKLTCGFKNDMRNLANFRRLKNSGFILESKMAELNQNQNSKQLYQLDACIVKPKIQTNRLATLFGQNVQKLSMLVELY